MNFEDLTPEQKKQARECKTPEDMLAFAKQGGYALTDEELGLISGGKFWDFSDCPYYGVD